MNHEQCRVARAMLGWSAKELSRKSHVGERTILEFENKIRNISSRTSGKLRSLFAVNGIEFILDDVGIGLRRRFSIDEYIDIYGKKYPRTHPNDLDALEIDATG